MAVVLTDRARGRFFDNVLGGVPLVASPAVWFGLSFGAANEAGLVVEPARSAGYRRVRRANVLGEFPAFAAVGIKSNLRPIVFGPATADWSPIRSLFVADADGDDPDAAVLAMIDLPPAGPLLAGRTLELGRGVLCWS